MARPRAHLAIIIGIALYALLGVSMAATTSLTNGNSWKYKRDVHRHQHSLPSLRARIKFNNYDRSFKTGHTGEAERWPDIVIPLRRIVTNQTVAVPIRHPNGDVETVSLPVQKTQYHGTIPIPGDESDKRWVSGTHVTGNGQMLRASWNMTFPSPPGVGPSMKTDHQGVVHSKPTHISRPGSLLGYTFLSPQNRTEVSRIVQQVGSTNFNRDRSFHRTFSGSPSPTSFSEKSSAHRQVPVSSISTNNYFSGNSESPDISGSFNQGVLVSPTHASFVNGPFPQGTASSNTRTPFTSITNHQHDSTSLHRTSTDFLLRPSQSRTLNLVELYNSSRRTGNTHRRGRHNRFGTNEQFKDELAKENLIAVRNSNVKLKQNSSVGSTPLLQFGVASDVHSKTIHDIELDKSKDTNSNFMPSITPSPKTKKPRRDRKGKGKGKKTDKENRQSGKKHRSGKKNKAKDFSEKGTKQRQLRNKTESVQQDDPSIPIIASVSSPDTSSWTYQVAGRGNIDQGSLAPQIHSAQPSSLDSENEDATDDNHIEEDDKPQIVPPSAAETNTRKDFFHPVAHSMTIGLRLFVSDSASNCLQCPSDRVVVSKKGMKCGLFLFSALIPCSSDDPGTGVRLISRSKRVRRVLPEGSHTVILRIVKRQPNGAKNNLQTCIFKYTVKVNRCEIPPPFQNGVLNCTQGRAWGSQCSFRCHGDYELKGANTITCEGDDTGVQWSHALPQCVATHCPAPDKFPNGFHKCNSEKDGDQYRTGTICHRVCDGGFVLPTSLLTHESTTCIGPQWTHEVRNLQCTKSSPPTPKPGHCVPQQLQADKHGFAFVPKAEFVSADGKRESTVVCALEGPLGPGIYENVCEGTDSELRTTNLCRYSVEVLGLFCATPPGILHGSVKCVDAASEDYPLGTICHYVCSDHHVIPTSQLDIVSIICREDQTWNNSKTPECKRQIQPDLVAGSCDDFSTLSKNPHQVKLPLPEFLTNSGSDAQVFCNHTKVTGASLQFINHCTATDLELRSHSTCSYAVDIKVVSCEALSSPLNGKMSCSLQGESYRCDVKCLPTFHFASPFELPRGYVQCDLQSGLWDFQKKHDMTELPDCLPEMYTSLKTDLHFNVSTVYSCDDDDAVQLLHRNIRQHLLDRNRIICDQVDCTDLTYLCFHILNSESSIVETVWNVMANYSVEEEYYDYGGEREEPEAEVLLEKIQVETHKLVTSQQFHEDLQGIGATVIKESYYQSKIDLVCAEPGFFVDQMSLYCLQCPRGTYFHNRSCSPCPSNTYQDEMGKTSCKSCPVGTESERGMKSKTDCLALEGEEADPCESNPCQHGATCFNDNGSLLCMCATGFKGDLCEDGCPPDFCQNGGTCYSDKGSFNCMCSDGYSGSHCESSAGQAALSDGKSVSASFHGHPYAAAQRGWRLHPCITSPCHEGSTCIPVAAQPYYHCQCPVGRTGLHCEHRQCPLAYHNFCHNGATCAIMAETQAWVCLCRKGFMGPRCEIRESDTGSVHHKAQVQSHILPLHSTQRGIPHDRHGR